MGVWLLLSRTCRRPSDSKPVRSHAHSPEESRLSPSPPPRHAGHLLSPGGPLPGFPRPSSQPGPPGPLRRDLSVLRGCLPAIVLLRPVVSQCICRDVSVWHPHCKVTGAAPAHVSSPPAPYSFARPGKPSSHVKVLRPDAWAPAPSCPKRLWEWRPISRRSQP